MTLEDVDKFTSEFLNALGNSSIYKFDMGKFVESKDEIKKFILLNQSLAKSYVAISQFTEKEPLLTPEERSIFLYWVAIHMVSSVLEFCKKMLKLCLNDQEIIFDEKITYGSLVSRICQKLHFSEPQRIKLMDVLYVNFRNSIAHEDYNVTKEGVVLFDGDDETHLNSTQIRNALGEVMMILTSMKDFLEIKAKESS